MNGVNSIHIVGLIGNAPELRNSGNGKPMCRISVATNDYNETNWHRVVLFGATAEFTGKYLKKGDPVYIEGRMRYREYEQDGQKRVSAEISARTLQALSPKEHPVTGDVEPPKDYPRDGVPF